MTKKQNRERKYGNAQRAAMGSPNIMNQPDALKRASRWEERIKRSGTTVVPTVTFH